ncbi:MAG: lipid A biosynthesis (KDO)2-(lauroyl)-lipid IVA acyltransferase [Bacteroidales bacterium]|jgi:predicted LPLAT superfamily acyltransferase|nr:lipid A biosynthesis (KDO)2-(lauroyl)-lipid IVA acyltransferase [Bacteroidales bacterium]
MAANHQRKWAGVTGGSVLGQKALLLLFRMVGIKTLYAVMALVIPFYMLFRPQGYRPVYRYFRKHFHCSPFRAFLKTYRNHFVFGQCLLDRFSVYSGKHNFSLQFTGNQYFKELIAGEKGFIIASSHTGNFELSGYLLQQNRKVIHTLVYGGETKEIMKNRTRVLHKNHISLIPVDNDLSHIFAVNDALSGGNAVSTPCDRISGSERYVECSFLEGKADFPTGAFMMAMQFDVPVIAIFVMKESLSRYHLYVRPIRIEHADTLSKKEKAALYATTFAKELEIIVKKYPEQWFNYYEFWKK